MRSQKLKFYLWELKMKKLIAYVQNLNMKNKNLIINDREDMNDKIKNLFYKNN